MYVCSCRPGIGWARGHRTKSKHCSCGFQKQGVSMDTFQPTISDTLPRCACVCMWKVLPTRIPTAVAMLFLHFARFPLTFVPVLWTDSGPQLPCLVCFERMSCMGFGQPWLQLCCVTVPKEVHKEYHNPPPTRNKSLWEPSRKHIRRIGAFLFISCDRVWD